MNVPPKLKNIIRENSTFLIVSHINPEADAIGSSIGLALGLKKLGKHVYILGKDPLPSFLRFLPGSHLFKTRKPSRESDVLCVIDCNTQERTGLKGLRARTTLIIDHHIPPPNATRHMFGSKTLVPFIDENASAAGELVYKVLHSLRVPLDSTIATNLYTSIYSDTGGFRYSNTNPECLKISSLLIEAGANPWEVTKELYESIPLKRIQLLTLMLSTLEKKGSIAWVTIRKDMYKKTGTGVEDTDDFVNYPRKIKGVEVAVLFREDEKDVYKISFRSKGRVNVAGIAQAFGGGGHANAAGCRLKGPLQKVKKKVFQAIQAAANNRVSIH